MSRKTKWNCRICVNSPRIYKKGHGDIFAVAVSVTAASIMSARTIQALTCAANAATLREYVLSFHSQNKRLSTETVHKSLSRNYKETKEYILHSVIFPYVLATGRSVSPWHLWKTEGCCRKRSRRSYLMFWQDTPAYSYPPHFVSGNFTSAVRDSKMNKRPHLSSSCSISTRHFTP